MTASAPTRGLPAPEPVRRPRAAAVLLLAGLALSPSCSGGGEGDGSGAAATSRETAPVRYRFTDVTAASGLGAFTQVNGDPAKPFLVETVGGGCALFDHDLDGDLDAYLTNGGVLGRPESENPSDALFLNDGTGRFEDGTAAAGIDERRWTNGVRAFDLDGDGWRDLYLTNYGRNTLYVADGRGGYRDRTEEAGIGDPSWSTGASFLDHDRDGDLDLHVANYVEFDGERMLRERPTKEYEGLEVMLGPRGLPGAPDVFYVNEGGLSFREATAEVGMQEEQFGFQSVALDFDEDGWIDLYVANDSVANGLWRNLEGRRFEDVALRQGLALSMAGRPQAGMGVAVGDYDGDLRPDLYVTNFTNDYSTLYHAGERGFFLDVTQSMGLAAPTMDRLSWGTGFEDFDLDGDLEIYAVNGHVYPQVDQLPFGTTYRQPAQLFELEGGRYVVPPGGAGEDLEYPAAARGTAVGDVDGDGDLDLLIEDIDGPPRLLRNDARAGNRLVVRLVGAGENREAVGARAVVHVGEARQLRLPGLGYGFLSSAPADLVFGLGAAEGADALEVTWPDGRTERFEGLPANARVVVEEMPGGEARVTVQGG